MMTFTSWRNKIKSIFSIQHLRSNNSRIVALLLFSKKGEAFTSIKGNIVLDGMSSLWNVNVGHGRGEMGRRSKRENDKAYI
ncbi:MAG: hypothetical protein ACQEWV_16440 [Bacillota bacterium]